MKRLVIVLTSFLLLAPVIRGQILPDAPAAPLDPSWNRLGSLTAGRPIVVTTADNRMLHCLFGSVTESYLFCNPPGNPEGVGYRFDRAEITRVDFDRPGESPTQVRKPERNYHPAWISSMIAGGLIVGIVAAQNTDADRAARDGLIGAAVVGAIGAPFVFLPQPYGPPPYSGPLYGMNIRLRNPRAFHPHRFLHSR